LPGIIAVRQSFTQEALDRLLGRACQSGDLLFRGAGSLNPPAIGGQALTRRNPLGETKTAFQFVPRTGEFAPLEGGNALQRVLLIVQVLMNRFAGIIALAATGFSGQGIQPAFKFRFEAHAERVKQV
jgi:hypothetical protein